MAQACLPIFWRRDFGWQPGIHPFRWRNDACGYFTLTGERKRPYKLVQVYNSQAFFRFYQMGYVSLSQNHLDLTGVNYAAVAQHSQNLQTDLGIVMPDAGGAPCDLRL